jgi:uncharacterized protein YjbI with pentapeptide repeats
MCAAPSSITVSAAHAADCKAAPEPGIDWRGCNKSSLVLSGSSLDKANLFGADFNYTDLRQSSFVGANLEKAALIRSSLAGSKADQANFSRIEGYRTSFSGVSAQQANFASAELQRADFSNANLTGADFRKAELGRANFQGAVITGAAFGMANLSRAKLAAAKYKGPLDFTGAFLFLTRIEGMDLSASTGLVQWQVDETCGDANTKLPEGLEPAADWPCPPDDD